MLGQPLLKDHFLDFVANLRCGGHLDSGQQEQVVQSHTSHQEFLWSDHTVMATASSDSISLCCLRDSWLRAPFDDVSESGKVLARDVAAADKSGAHHCFV